MKLPLLLLLACGTLSAAEPAAPKSPTEVLLDVMRYEEMTVDSAVAAFDGFIDQMKQQGVPKEAIGEIRDEARKMYLRTFATPGMRKKMVDLYNKHFNEEEILEMTEFYRTPLGQKTLAAMPSIAADSMAVAMPAIQKEMPAFQQKVAEIVEKHQKPAEEEEK